MNIDMALYQNGNIRPERIQLPHVAEISQRGGTEARVGQYLSQCFDSHELLMMMVVLRLLLMF